MALRLKSISKINAKSSINENITIDAKHNDMVKHFKDLLAFNSISMNL